MTAKISTKLGEAIIENGEWSAKNKMLERYLNTVCDPNHMPGYLPNPDMNAAVLAVKKLPGTELIEYDEIDYADEPEGTIY